jgi:hypothetical protein
MNDENQTPPSSQNTPNPPYQSRHEQRRAERWARREARWQGRGGRHYGWVGGAILIFIGIIFLLQNMGYVFLFNWWALFILIPAFFLFVGAWDSYQQNGRLTRGAAFSLTWGCIFTLAALVFLFNVNLGLYWPILLIVGGVLLLASAFLPG